MILKNRIHHVAITLIAGLLLASAAHARQGTLPYSLSQHAKLAVVVPIEDVTAVDAARMRADSEIRAHATGPRAKRMLVARGSAVAIDPSHNGVWTTLGDGSGLWRMSVRARGATDLRLGFSRYALPSGAMLYVIGRDNYYQGPYTATDAINGGFQAPLVPGDMATVELRVPPNANIAPSTLELTSVGAGFRDRFRLTKADASDLGRSGPCNVDVVCPLGQSYPDEVRAVGQYEVQDEADRNYYLCTGTLLADIPRDRKNYFLTAAHCVPNSSAAASVVIYWNYQSTLCNGLSAPAGGFFNDDQHGAFLRATRNDVDFSLLELSDTPDPAWHVFYAGWDVSGATPTGTIGIHHPSGDVKKITAGPSPGTTGNCISDTATATDTHWATGPYTQGTTENGSSGSGLFTPSADLRARLLIGTLSGGDASCSSTMPTQPDAGTDCYGKLAIAWDGASADSRLRDWLDPARTGASSITGVESFVLPTLRGHSTHAIPAIISGARIRP